MKATIRKGLTCTSVIGLILVLAVGQAAAIPMVNFMRTDPSSPGALGYLGGASALVGSISMQSAQWRVTGGTDLCTGGPCTFAFSTGAAVGPWSWTGGSFTISGTIRGVTGILYSGSISSASVVQGQNPNSLHILFGFIPTGAALNPLLAATFGGSMPSTGFHGDFSFGFDTVDEIFVGSAFFSDSINVGHVNGEVPEPTSLILLGTGLTGLAFLGRRRFHRKVAK